MKVEFSDEARQQVRREAAWWRQNRDIKELFTRELRAARKRLKDAPKHQVYATINGEPVRRTLLGRTGCHIYYVILEREKLVRIVAVWGAARGHGPDFG